MSGSFNNLILKLRRQINKIITVAGHPNDQVPVIVRVILCLAQFLTVNHVKLHMVAVHLKVSPN